MSVNIDCKLFKNINSNEIMTLFNSPTFSTLEVHEKSYRINKWLLDIRTQICAHGICSQFYKRSHRRISIYNWEKIKQKNKIEYIQFIEKQAVKLLKWITSTSASKKLMYEASRPYIKGNTSSAKQIFQKVEGCLYCCNPKISNIEHIHFVKETLNYENNMEINIPIESIFTSIDKTVELNGITTHPTKPIKQTTERSNNIRMTYGDINYIDSNKAYLYFDRGYQGIQTFSNSIQSLKMQPSHKDIIILDDIVFTSECKCKSATQHKKVFPHYRVTCAEGLTCPAKLNKNERLLYALRKKAPNSSFTTARNRLIRSWR